MDYTQCQHAFLNFFSFFIKSENDLSDSLKLCGFVFSIQIGLAAIANNPLKKRNKLSP